MHLHVCMHVWILYTFLFVRNPFFLLPTKNPPALFGISHSHDLTNSISQKRAHFTCRWMSSRALPPPLTRPAPSIARPPYLEEREPLASRAGCRGRTASDTHAGRSGEGMREGKMLGMERKLRQRDYVQGRYKRKRDLRGCIWAEEEVDYLENTEPFGKVGRQNWRWME